MQRRSTLPANMLISIAQSKSAANRLAKSLSAADLKKAISHLESALIAIEKREATKAAKKQTANLKKLKAMMADMELTAADVRSLTASSAKRKTGQRKTTGRGKTDPRKGKKVAPKYQLKVGKGLHKWSGRGLMPLVFKEFLDKNGSLEKCLIK